MSEELTWGAWPVKLIPQGKTHDFERGESIKPEPSRTLAAGCGRSTSSGTNGKLGLCVVDRRVTPSVLSVGIAWASRITTLALEFSIPVVIGVALDRWWRTGPLFTVSGAVLGFGLFMLHTLRMAKELAIETDRTAARARDDGK